MAQRVDVKPLPTFDPLSDSSSLSQRWKLWKRRFETYLVAINVTDNTQKRALLLYQVGQETKELFETFTDTGTDYKTAMDKLDAYFNPKKNVDFEVFQFRQAKQQEDETIDQFITRLRKLAVTCEFTEFDKELKSAVIQHCTSKPLRRYALREEGLTLDKLMSKARALEASEQQAKGMEETSDKNTKINYVSQRYQKSNLTRQDQRKQHPAQQRRQQPPQRKHGLPHKQSTQCRQCGYTWPHTRGPCPAIGKTCTTCGKPNHFAQMCLTGKVWPTSRDAKQPPQQKNRSPQVRQVRVQPDRTSESSDEEYLFTLGLKDGDGKVPKITVTVNGIPISMMVDTGASTNIMDEATFSKLQSIELQSTSSRIFAYGSESQLSVLGKFKIVLPSKLRRRAINIAHEGHQGIVKTKQLLREKVWFPGIDKEVQEVVGECIACQANGADKHPNPLQMSPLPPEPWHTIHIDFCGPFPNGDYLLVTIDA